VEALAEQEGVNLALVLSRDGFILESEEGKETVDPEAVGVAVTTLWRAADEAGIEIELGAGANGLLEYKDGLLSTAVVRDADVILAIVADRDMNPATIRHLTVKFSELLAHVL
jgi:predicted regulator of Ras-like GTPase activity (Roadblock/LC7/MglB family)